MLVRLVGSQSTNNGLQCLNRGYIPHYQPWIHRCWEICFDLWQRRVSLTLASSRNSQCLHSRSFGIGDVVVVVAAAAVASLAGAGGVSADNLQYYNLQMKTYVHISYPLLIIERSTCVIAYRPSMIASGFIQFNHDCVWMCLYTKTKGDHL